MADENNLEGGLWNPFEDKSFHDTLEYKLHKARHNAAEKDKQAVRKKKKEEEEEEEKKKHAAKEKFDRAQKLLREQEENQKRLASLGLSNTELKNLKNAYTKPVTGSKRGSVTGVGSKSGQSKTVNGKKTGRPNNAPGSNWTNVGPKSVTSGKRTSRFGALKRKLTPNRGIGNFFNRFSPNRKTNRTPSSNRPAVTVKRPNNAINAKINNNSNNLPIVTARPINGIVNVTGKFIPMGHLVSGEPIVPSAPGAVTSGKKNSSKIKPVAPTGKKSGPTQPIQSKGSAPAKLEHATFKPSLRTIPTSTIKSNVRMHERIKGFNRINAVNRKKLQNAFQRHRENLNTAIDEIKFADLPYGDSAIEQNRKRRERNNRMQSRKHEGSPVSQKKSKNVKTRQKARGNTGAPRLVLSAKKSSDLIDLSGP